VDRVGSTERRFRRRRNVLARLAGPRPRTGRRNSFLRTRTHDRLGRRRHRELVRAHAGRGPVAAPDHLACVRDRGCGLLVSRRVPPLDRRPRRFADRGLERIAALGGALVLAGYLEVLFLRSLRQRSSAGSPLSSPLASGPRFSGRRWRFLHCFPISAFWSRRCWLTSHSRSCLRSRACAARCGWSRRRFASPCSPPSSSRPRPSSRTRG
jgi:hypothetical protein